MAINPLQKPIDYAGMVPQVNISQGIEDLGAAFAKRQERVTAEAQAAQYATDLADAIADPKQEKFAQLILKHPKQYQAIDTARKSYGEEKLKNDFNQGFEISTALENVNPDVAKSKLELIIEAKKNSGESPLVYEQIRDAVDRGDITEAQAGVNAALVIIDPERFKKTVEAQVAARKAPSDVSEAIAKADKAVADAVTAQATAGTAEEKAAADLLKAQADATKADIQAQFEEKNQKADIKKKAADLGLTTAQTNKVLVETRKAGTEAKKAALELEAFKKTGGIDPDKVFGYEEKIRKEYQTRTGKYRELDGTFSNIKTSAASANGPGDIALITSFMKMLDPGSVVRETEFATGRDTAGLYANLQNRLQKAQNGQFLNKTQRDEYVALSKQYLDASKKRANEEKESLGKVVKNYGLNPENVFGIEAPVAAPAAPAPTLSASEQAELAELRKRFKAGT
jgi:hypothetical protein